MTDRRLIARLFDNAEPLVSARYQPINGIEYQPGQVIDADLNHSVRMRLWLSRLAVYERDFSPTPIADAEAAQAGPEVPEADQWMILADGVGVTIGDGENYFIKADWLNEVETVGGTEAAQARAEALRAEGRAYIAAAGGEGAEAVVTGPDGEPILDEDGNPIAAAVLIGEDGEPINPPLGDPSEPGEIAPIEGEGERTVLEAGTDDQGAIAAPAEAAPEAPAPEAKPARKTTRKN